MLDSLVKAAGVERFLMHDLRRTTRSTMGRLGISNETQRLCIGQQAGTTLDQIYNRDDAWPRRVDAFQRYHAHIRNPLDNKTKVIAFPEQALAS
jgi:hypothetical protein